MGAPYTFLHYAISLAHRVQKQMQSDPTVRFCWTNRAFTGSCTRKKSFTVTVLDSAHRFRSCLA